MWTGVPAAPWYHPGMNHGSIARGTLSVIAGVWAFSGVAHAGPIDDASQTYRGDMGRLFRAFALPAGASEVAAINELSETTDFECGRRKDLAADAIAFITIECTSAIATRDPGVCRGAAVLALLQMRGMQLNSGDGRSFRYVVTCDGYTLKGDLIGAGHGSYTDGLLDMHQIRTADGEDLGPWSTDLPWPVVAPDPSAPYWWGRNLMFQAEPYLVQIQTLGEELESGTPLSVDPAAFEDGLATLVTQVEAFPPLSADDGLRARVIAWATTLSADLDHGDLARLIARTHETAARRKLRKRGKLKGADAIPTPKLLARETAVLARNLDAIEDAADAFFKAHAQD